MKTIDSIRPPVRPRRSQAAQLRTSEATGTGARFTKFKATTRRRRIAWGLVATVLGSPLLVGLAIFRLVGVAVLILVGVAFVILRVPSRNIFTLALMALIYMAGIRLSGGTEIAGPLATQAYVLLAVGAFSLAREVKSANRLWFKKH